MKGKKYILTVLLILAFSDSALAKCAMFDFYANLSAIPNIIRARVVESNVPDCNAWQDIGCNYSFSASVLEAIKGEAGLAELRFSYPYKQGCPGVMTFQSGKEYLLAVKRISSDGSAELFGVNCGRWGLPLSELKKLKRNLDNN